MNKFLQTQVLFDVSIAFLCSAQAEAQHHADIARRSMLTLKDPESKAMMEEELSECQAFADAAELLHNRAVRMHRTFKDAKEKAETLKNPDLFSFFMLRYEGGDDPKVNLRRVKEALQCLEEDYSEAAARMNTKCPSFAPAYEAIDCRIKYTEDAEKLIGEIVEGEQLAKLLPKALAESSERGDIGHFEALARLKAIVESCNKLKRENLEIFIQISGA